MRALRRTKVQDLLAHGTATCIVESRRFVKRPLSPDRNYNETIQDAQNSFRWHEKHAFRPHQHFTYDPSSWSRPLAEKEKKKKKLSLVTRLEMEAERAADAHRNHEMMNGLAHASLEAMGDGHMVGETADGRETSTGKEAEASAPDVWADVRLQEMLDELTYLRRLLTARRYSRGASLVIRERQRQDRDKLLLRVFSRLQLAEVGRTVTLDALVYSWFVLVRNAAELVLALSRQAELIPGSASMTEEEAVAAVFTALQASFLSLFTGPSPAFFSTSEEEVSLEAVIESAFIMQHGFVTQCAARYGDADVPGALEEALARLGSGVHQLLLWRLTDADRLDSANPSPSGEEGHREVLDPVHSEALAAVVQSLTELLGSEVLEITGPLMLRVLHAEAGYLKALLESSIGGRRHSDLRAALSRRRSIGVKRAADSKEEAEGVSTAERDGNAAGPFQHSFHSSPVVLDHTKPSEGVATPLTEADDVGCLLQAFAHVLTAPRSSSAAADATLVDTLDRVLALVAHTPNYDLEPSAAVRFANAVVSSGALFGLSHRDRFGQTLTQGKATEKKGSNANNEEENLHGSVAERMLRFALFLSRIDVAQAFNRSSGHRQQHLPQLLQHLCTLSPPPSADPDTTDGREKKEALQRLREWRRLRGVAVHRVLEVLSITDLTPVEEDGKVVGRDGMEWEQWLAFGAYDGLVPMPLWREACLRRFAGRVDALALVLHAPISLPETHSMVSPRTAEALLRLRGRPYLQPRQSRQCHLEAAALPLVALCVEAASGGKLSATGLLQEPPLWESAASFVDLEDGPDGEGVQLLLADARRLVANRSRSSANVAFL